MCAKNKNSFNRSSYSRFVCHTLLLLITMTCLSFQQTTVAHAGVPAFSQLSSSEVKDVVKDFSAWSGFHSVMPAGGLGKIFGVEAGVIAGASRANSIETLSHRVSSSAGVAQLPYAALVGALTIPFGITAEIMVLPEISVLSGLKAHQTGLAAKWVLTDSILPGLGFNLSARGYWTGSGISFNQTLSDNGVNVNAGVEYTGTLLGLQVLASPSFLPMLEPYAGVGFVSADGELAVSGTTTATLFAGSQAKMASTTATSPQFLAGVNVRLLLLVFGLEYAHDFSDSFTGKVSLRF